MNPTVAELRSIHQQLTVAARPKSVAEPPRLGGRPDLRNDHQRLADGVRDALNRLDRCIVTLEGS